MLRLLVLPCLGVKASCVGEGSEGKGRRLVQKVRGSSSEPQMTGFESQVHGYLGCDLRQAPSPPLCLHFSICRVDLIMIASCLLELWRKIRELYKALDSFWQVASAPRGTETRQ